jgi:hypothetical protein
MQVNLLAQELNYPCPNKCHFGAHTWHLIPQQSELVVI